MPKNNGKRRRLWRKQRADISWWVNITPQERLLMAIFNERLPGADDDKPDTNGK